jgi:hypothetical protein
MPNDQGNVTVDELRESVGSGYNLVAIVEPDFEVDNLDVFRERGIPVLAECKGIMGCLRGLETPGRAPGTMAAMAEDGKEHQLLHLQFLGDCAELTQYKFKLLEE